MIPLGVVWAGYTLVWYGFCLIKGPGLGLTDLIKPSGVAKVDAFLSGNGNNGSISLGNNNPAGQPKNPASFPGGPRAPDGTPLTPPNAVTA